MWSRCRAAVRWASNSSFCAMYFPTFRTLTLTLSGRTGMVYGLLKPRTETTCRYALGNAGKYHCWPKCTKAQDRPCLPSPIYRASWAIPRARTPPIKSSTILACGCGRPKRPWSVSPAFQRQRAGSSAHPLALFLYSGRSSVWRSASRT